MLILENKNPPMRKLTQPWKLCRSFGSQPVGNVAGPRWPKAGIAAQVIPPLPSRRTFRKGQSPTGDLPTCVLDSSCSSEVPTIFNSKVGKFAASFSCRPRLPFQGSAILSERHLRYFARGPILLNSPFPNGNSEEPATKAVSLEHSKPSRAPATVQTPAPVSWRIISQQLSRRLFPNENSAEHNPMRISLK